MLLGIAGEPFGFVVFAPRQQALRFLHQQSGIFVAIAFRILLTLLGLQAVVAIQQGFDLRRAVFHRSVADAGGLGLLQLAGGAAASPSAKALRAPFRQSIAFAAGHAAPSGARNSGALRDACGEYCGIAAIPVDG